uniref:Uncharacterized protein n=1 Tax=uncultured marine group II/III euryarchaeote KM3_110_C01 TaxID=1457851 RepID=A0A075GBX0_9EURY|nr:hypothetical protein [uncultured marine group II/III euryarchaeote KM3_110_C01]
MKNMQPLEVTPMLGSAPSSPTSLKTKLSGKGGSSTARPSGPVTKTPSGREGSSGGGGGGVASWRHPARALAETMRKTIASCMKRD